ncbi:MAG: hypothetical protein [Podoviridae sp. ctda_1]|nr:MAG: hypothetical protein [Podoviridae sp. ctda_1]
MGMFGSRKKTYVSSVVYNMAGDVNQRPNYLKTTVIGAVMSQSPSLGNSITQSYIDGPGLRLRAFARWARTSGYTDTVGLVTGSLAVGNSVNRGQLANEIPHGTNQVVQLQSVRIGEADYTFWADQWMLDNHPERINEEYRSDIVGNTITIYFNDVATYTFTVSDFDINSRYLYASYQLADNPTTGPVVPGTEIVLGPTDPFPSTTGWDEKSNTSANADVTLKTVTKVEITYSDGRPGSTTETPAERIESVLEKHRVYEKTEFMGAKPDGSTYSIKSTMYQDEVKNVTTEVTSNSVDEDIGGGVIKTTKTTVTKEVLSLKKSHRTDTQETVMSKLGPVKIFIYKHMSGNAVLDAMFNPTNGNQMFFPPIPFRVDNKFISPSYMPDVYEESKKALKKASKGAKYDKIIENIADNESLGDIDYAYAVFGVSLNVKEVACREYIYRFFKGILDAEGVGGDGAYNAWKAQWNAADASQKQWKKWQDAQSNPSDPLYGTPEPNRIGYPPMQTQSMKVTTDNKRVLNYSITIEWQSMTETTGTGQARPGAKKGDVWFTVGADEEFEEVGNSGGVWGVVASQLVNNITMHWQDGTNTWRRLAIRGLEHWNLIYNGKTVHTDAKEALADTDESGFIVPLHEGIYRAMSLKKSTQMSTACVFLVFNCYTVKKKKWYQTGIFQIIIIIVIIVISIYSGGAGGAAAGGLLGTNAAVGAAIGLTGMAAIIVGAIANAIAAMLLVTIIQRGAVAIFGDKLGSIIGAVAAVVAVAVGTGMANGQSFSSSFANLGRADNLLRLTAAGMDGYSKYIQYSTQDTLMEIQRTLEAYKVESSEISEAYAREFGMNRGVIDPMMLTDAGRQTFIPEPRQDFIDRTLLLGSEICDISLDMIGKFAEISLSNKLPT